jgi:hypothetical protein
MKKEAVKFRGVFADKRLDARCEQLYGAMLEEKSVVLHQCMSNRAALIGAYRFMNNQHVRYEQVREWLTGNWNAAGKRLMCIQDTSEANFTSHSGALSIKDPDLGPLTKSTETGFFLHPSLCLDLEDGFPLGFSDLLLFNRCWGQPDKHQRHYQQLALEQKESYRWLACAQNSQQKLSQAAYVLFVFDREADIYDLFYRLPDEKSDVLVRLTQDRLLYQGSDQTRKMSQLLAQCPAETISLPVRKSGQRQARVAELAVKYTHLQVASPKNGIGAKTSAAVWVIEAVEQPAGVPRGEEPICWRLITSIEVETLAQAVQCLYYYSLRWRVEELFAVVKSQGLQLEESRLASGKALKVTAALALQGALQIIQLKEGREREDKAASLAFNPHELAFLALLCKKLAGKTQKQQNPYPEGTLAYAAWVIGRLGGWKGLNSQGKAGIKTIAWGLEIFYQHYQGYLLAFS